MSQLFSIYIRFYINFSLININKKLLAPFSSLMEFGLTFILIFHNYILRNIFYVKYNLKLNQKIKNLK